MPDLTLTNFVKVNHEKKKLLLSIESWLFNRDPYNGWLKSPYNWVVESSIKTINNQVFCIAQVIYYSPQDPKKLVHGR